jgi:hypothetical protein
MLFVDEEDPEYGCFTPSAYGEYAMRCGIIREKIWDYHTKTADNRKWGEFIKETTIPEVIALRKEYEEMGKNFDNSITILKNLQQLFIAC